MNQPLSRCNRIVHTVSMIIGIVICLAVLTGCPVTQSQDTPISPTKQREASTRRVYRLYVPSYYDENRSWPLVVTLHGTHGWDSSRAQIKEWKALAEAKGFIVAAPALKSVQGILPVLKGPWFKDLASDERSILSVIDEVSDNYNVDPNAVLLTGFSAGGYPLYYVGLRNPDRFNMLVARACNSSEDIFETIEVTEQVRQMPIVIFWGKDDLNRIADQSWAAYRWLRENRCFSTSKQKTQGGHLRRPALAYRFWSKQLPEKHRR